MMCKILPKTKRAGCRKGPLHSSLPSFLTAAFVVRACWVDVLAIVWFVVKEGRQT
jgi:hypothetical protein